MTSYEIPLGPSESMMVHRNGTVVHHKNGQKFYPRLFVEVQARKFCKYYYQRFYLKGKRYYLHRLLAIGFVENPSNWPVVNHKDGNSLNNSIDNLEWCPNSAVIVDTLRDEQAQAHYATVDRRKLSQHDRAVFDYYTKGNETGILQLFQTERLRKICSWTVSAADQVRFSLLYDELYEVVLLRIKRGIYLPGDRDRFFNYVVFTCRWLDFEKKKFQRALPAEYEETHEYSH